MHWLLERADDPTAVQDPAMLAQAARRFELTQDQARDATAKAATIRHGEGAWAWDDAVIDWQGNEVTLIHQGETLRIDRLVRRRDTGAWWVLDHKSASNPETEPELQAQLQRYRTAVLLVSPGEWL